MLFLVVMPHFRQKMRRLYGLAGKTTLEQRRIVVTSLQKSLQSTQGGNST